MFHWNHLRLSNLETKCSERFERESRQREKLKLDVFLRVKIVVGFHADSRRFFSDRTTKNDELKCIIGKRSRCVCKRCKLNFWMSLCRSNLGWLTRCLSLPLDPIMQLVQLDRDIK